MLQYIIRRLALSIPTLVAISLIVFGLLDLAPGDPTSQLPLTIPPELRENILDHAAEGFWINRTHGLSHRLLPS